MADADVVDYLEWFYRTGMRPKEIKSLTWAAFDRETWALTLPAKDAKIGKPRTLPSAGGMARDYRTPYQSADDRGSGR